MDPISIHIKDYSYSLPEEKIAKYPLAERDSSKLLIYNSGRIGEDIYRNIANYLPQHSLIVFNDTKVIEARVYFQKKTGGVIEIFCLEPADNYKDITSAMSATKSVVWKCLIGGASKWKHGLVPEKILKSGDHTISLKATINERLKDCFIINFTWEPENYSFAEILHLAGAIPLPPYIKREADHFDSERYQTIYAREKGSVAAPTAGLHFSEKIFRELEGRNIRKEYVTLHVGAGTFMPVKNETIANHEMHSEFIEINSNLIDSILQSPVITAVGTTTLRTLETMYWLGVKIITHSPGEEKELGLSQWEAYDLPQAIDSEEALLELKNWMNRKNLQRLITKTQLLIVPGYQLRVVDILVTNFHQPQSTLLLLVAAIAGHDWKNIYEYALQHDFRFLSYGDGCLIYT